MKLAKKNHFPLETKLSGSFSGRKSWINLLVCVRVMKKEEEEKYNT